MRIKTSYYPDWLLISMTFETIDDYKRFCKLLENMEGIKLAPD